MTENIYRLIGGNNYYQYFIICLICISQFNTSYNVLVPIFINNYQDFLCNVPDNDSTRVLISHRTQFKGIDNTTDSLIIDSSKCHFAKVSNICLSIVLKPDIMTSTVRSQFQLYCEYHRLSTFAVFVFMVGISLGSASGGLIADNFGRIPLCVFSYLMISLSSIIAAVSPWFSLHVIARLFAGFAVSGSYIANSGIIMELVNFDQRSNFGFYWNLGYDGGYILLVAMAYFIRNHCTLQLAMNSLSLLSLLFPFFYKESFRWLLANKKYDKAKTVMMHIAKFNKKSVSENQIDKLIELYDEERTNNLVKSVSIKELFKYKIVLINLLILWYLFFSCSFSYYTFILGSSKISDQIFLSTSITALFGFFLRVIYLILCRRNKRINILLSFQCGLAILFIGSIIIKHFLGSKNIVSSLLLIMSIGLSSVNFGFMWVYGGEVFPTVIRATSVSLGSFMARVAGMIATQMEYVFEISPNSLPILGALMCIFGALFVLFILPETFHKPSLDFLPEAEKYFVQWRQPWRIKRSVNISEKKIDV